MPQHSNLGRFCPNIWIHSIASSFRATRMRPCMESNAKTGDQRERSECLPVAHACTFRRLHCSHVRFQPPHIHKNGDNFSNKERYNEKNEEKSISLLIWKKKTFQNSSSRIIIQFKLSFQKETGRNISIYFFTKAFLSLIINNCLLKILFH